MSNMSYCRFENTTRDVADCHNALGGMMEGEETIVEGRERDAAQRLLHKAVEMVQLLMEVTGCDWDDLEMNADKPIAKFFAELEKNNAD